MNRACQITLISALLLTCQTAFSSGYEWVRPGEYTFGSCSGVGNENAPTGYANVKYYKRYDCDKAYNDQDRCYIIAKNLERHLHQIGALNACQNWLTSELNACRRFVAQAGRQCADLAN